VDTSRSNAEQLMLTGKSTGIIYINGLLEGRERNTTCNKGSERTENLDVDKNTVYKDGYYIINKSNFYIRKAKYNRAFMMLHGDNNE